MKTAIILFSLAILILVVGPYFLDWIADEADDPFGPDE